MVSQQPHKAVVPCNKDLCALGNTMIVTSTKVNCCGASCERPAFDNEDALEILNNQSHAKQTLHEVVIEEIKKDIES